MAASAFSFRLRGILQTTRLPYGIRYRIISKKSRSTELRLRSFVQKKFKKGQLFYSQEGSVTLSVRVDGMSQIHSIDMNYHLLLSWILRSHHENEVKSELFLLPHRQLFPHDNGRL